MDDRETIIHSPPANPFNEQVMADARLIAAAPELLHACELMVKNGPLIAEWLKANDSAALAQVSAAIAKATGEGQ